MVTAADVLLWTKLTISDAIVTEFSAAAEERLIQDGVGDLSGSTRTQALCYLIAAYNQSGGSKAELQSENIGGYSYSKKATKSSLNIWMDMYLEMLPKLAAGGGLTTATSGCAQRVDSAVVVLHRRFF